MYAPDDLALATAEGGPIRLLLQYRAGADRRTHIVETHAPAAPAKTLPTLCGRWMPTSSDDVAHCDPRGPETPCSYCVGVAVGLVPNAHQLRAERAGRHDRTVDLG